MWKSLRRRAALAASAVLVAGMAACSSGEQSDPGITDNGATGDAKMTIGIASDEPGVSLQNGDTYAGFDIDTAQFVAGQLGVPSKNITWRELDPGERIAALETGAVDMVVATLSITPERAEKISFAGPYFIAHQDLLIRRNDTSITGPDRLDGKILCAASGTTSADYINANYRGRITVREVPTFSECVRNLVNGDIDAVSTDDLILAGFAAQPAYKGILKVVGNGFTDERYGIGLKKGDTETVDKVNTALKKFIDSGEWRKSLDRNVAPSGYEIPDPPTPGS